MSLSSSYIYKHYYAKELNIMVRDGLVNITKLEFLSWYSTSVHASLQTWRYHLRIPENGHLAIQSPANPPRAGGSASEDNPLFTIYLGRTRTTFIAIRHTSNTPADDQSGKQARGKYSRP
jgi:hypothetical protein